MCGLSAGGAPQLHCARRFFTPSAPRSLLANRVLVQPNRIPQRVDDGAPSLRKSIGIFLFTTVLEPPRDSGERTPVVRRARHPDVHAGVQLEVVR